MVFKPEVDEVITIDGEEYVFGAHPAIRNKRLLHVQKGRRARIYRLIKRSTGEEYALKEFLRDFQDQAQQDVALALSGFADLAGMRAARRKVITGGDLFNRYQELHYAVLMPWIGGGSLITWSEAISGLQSSKRALPRPDAHRLAAQFLSVMRSLEDRGAAHTDISSGNVVCDPYRRAVELIDLEDLFTTRPELERKNIGSPGYSHRAIPDEGIWSAVADRFSSAVMAAEMLAVSDASLIAMAPDDHLFTEDETQDPQSPTYVALLTYLRGHWPAFATLFEQAWRSPTLDDAPTLGALADSLKPTPADLKFNPKPADEIEIDRRTFVFVKHPVGKVTYCEKGEHADVYRVFEKGTSREFALKAYRTGERDARLVVLAWYLKKHVHLPGMMAATRTVVDEDTGGTRFLTTRKLRYATLMPWVPDALRPWREALIDLKSRGAALSVNDAHQLAARFLDVVAALEATGLAHTRLALGHVMCDLASGDVQLIGLESCFGPDWPIPPSPLPNTQDQPVAAVPWYDVWTAEADRFPAAVIAAEMLAASAERLVSSAVQPTYFDPTELGLASSRRYRELLAHLELRWPSFAAIFKRSWTATTSTNLPRVTELRAALGGKPRPADTRPPAPPSSAKPPPPPQQRSPSSQPPPLPPIQVLADSLRAPSTSTQPLPPKLTPSGVWLGLGAAIVAGAGWLAFRESVQTPPPVRTQPVLAVLGTIDSGSAPIDASRTGRSETRYQEGMSVDSRSSNSSAAAAITSPALDLLSPSDENRSSPWAGEWAGVEDRTSRHSVIVRFRSLAYEDCGTISTAGYNQRLTHCRFGAHRIGASIRGDQKFEDSHFRAELRDGELRGAISDIYDNSRRVTLQRRNEHSR